MWKRIRSVYRALTSRSAFEDGMTEELRFHVEQYADDLIQSGVSREEAQRRARLEFGSMISVKQDCRESRRLDLVDELVRETRHGLRLMRNSPAFTLTALATLGICLGANLTIFAVVDGVLLRPLPFPDAGRLVTMFNTYPKAGVDRDGSSITNYYERRGRIPAFESLAIYRRANAIVGETGSTEREQILQVSPEFFHTLGVGPAIGRAFNEEETTYRTDKVVILSDAFWRERFHGDSHVVGKQVRVDGQAGIVVGVLPRDFRFLSSTAKLFVPLSSGPENRMPIQRHSGGNSTQMIARLKPEASLAQAQSQIDLQNEALEADNPQGKMMADAGFRSLVVPLQADHVASIRPTLLLLQAGVLSLLLIGLVNLANLLLIRANGRVKELAVRQALGASRRHVVSEVMVETTLLAFCGGLLGLLIAAGGIRLLASFGAEQIPLGAEIVFDARLALAALAGTLVTSIILALPIAWFQLRAHLAMAIQSESRGGTSNQAAQRLRHGFIVAQVALAFMLLAGAGLLGLSLKRAMEVSPGFRTDHVLTGQISLPWNHYSNAKARMSFVDRLTAEIGRQPGVLSTGVVSNLPLSGNSGKSAAAVKGHVLRTGESPRGRYSYWVGGDYFGVMGLTLQEGRFLSADDSHRAERVCVVDDDFARYYWPSSSALGQRLFQGSEEGKASDAFVVVGVVRKVKQAELTDDVSQGAVYYPYVFRGDNDLFVVTRTALPPESLGLTLQRVVRQLDPDLPVNDVRTMETRVADSLATRRSPALLAGLFSAIAVLLTVLGTYGVLAYAVAQRRREIGLRMALGARPEQIRAQFLSLAVRLLFAGMTLGVFGAWLAGEAMQKVLYQVPAFHFATLAGSAIILALGTLAACLLPSHTAAKMSPMEALADH